MKRYAPLVFCLVVVLAAHAFAANSVTVLTPEAEPGQTGVRVDVCATNDVELLEYFNLLVFDATRLELVSLTPDRGGFWYGYYPTEIVGDHVYVHGWATDYPDCIDPSGGEPPGPALYHLVFDVKPDAPAGLAAVAFGVEGAFDGHWNNCSGYTVSPAPTYADGGVMVTEDTAVTGPAAVAAASVRPNPTSGSAHILFSLPEAGRVEVGVYDLAGRRIRTLRSDRLPAGEASLRWDGRDETGRPAAAGTYVCRVRTERDEAVIRLLKLR